MLVTRVVLSTSDLNEAADAIATSFQRCLCMQIGCMAVSAADLDSNCYCSELPSECSPGLETCAQRRGHGELLP